MMVDDTIKKNERKFHSLEKEIKTLKKSFSYMARSKTSNKSYSRST